MKSLFLRLISVLIVSILTLSSSGFGSDVCASPQQKSATKKQSATKRQRKGGGGQKTTASATGKSAKGGKGETSAEVKRRQEATQKEIRLTEEQIRENDRSIKAGLNELGKIDGDISVSKKRIAATTQKINGLNGKISGLESNISSNEAELKRLKDEYLKALKKMRVARKKNSGLAFIFASKNFNQALRRMRYLKQFSQWKDRQSAAIGTKTATLRTEKDNLAKARSEHDAALRTQKSEQASLRKQYERQDAIVAGLKENGTALKSHLSRKQAEANQLRNRIAALIAEEERRAAEERARQEAARRAEEERIAREEAARREAEEAARKAELLAAEQKAAEEKNEDKGKKSDLAEVKPPKDEKKSKDVKQKENEKKKKERKRKDKGKDKKSKKEVVKDVPKKDVTQNYADARKRKPRGGESAKIASAASSSAAAGNFGAMKGSLPRPVSGQFTVTSRFGRQSLPDLPDVVYENPGIDAEVSAGASALAVYGGKVSGVYMIPGYNTVVIVNHGNYYTVYGNISSPSVKVGDAVRAGQGLGALAPDEDNRGRSSIHFEVWRNREKLNPLEWIR